MITMPTATASVCRDGDGKELQYNNHQQVTNNHADCLEAPLMGVQFQSGYSTVDGNYGFGEGCFNGTLDASDPTDPACVGGTFEMLPGARDYLVEVVVPDDALGRPLYKVVREEDINVGNGDQFIPQVPPPACAGPLHTVDVFDNDPDADGYGPIVVDGVNVPASTPTVNDTFVEIGGSPYEGMQTPLCNIKLVPLANGRSTAPTFSSTPMCRSWALLGVDCR
ncbi:MAG: hypothetical protein R2932_34260 [Caldilineaceae bacterium]